MTVGLMLAYAFSPFPSNTIFIAYGLTGMRLWLIGFPFFIGRWISYLTWRHIAQIGARYLDEETEVDGPIWVRIFSYLRSCFWRSFTDSPNWIGGTSCKRSACAGGDRNQPNLPPKMQEQKQNADLPILCIPAQGAISGDRHVRHHHGRNRRQLDIATRFG